MATSAAPLVSRLNVVFLYVGDLRRSLGFYRDLLGIPLSGDDGWAEAELPGGTRFALHATHDGVGRPSSGTVHIDFEVADVEAAVDVLRGAGIPVGKPVRDEWGTSVEVLDPDGYRVYLFQPPRDT